MIILYNKKWKNLLKIKRRREQYINRVLLLERVLLFNSIYHKKIIMKNKI